MTAKVTVNKAMAAAVGHREVGFRILMETMRDTMISLAGRWAEEKEYEDIQDYQNVLTAKLPNPQWKITGMKKRPFGCFIKREGFEDAFLFCSATKYGIRLKVKK